MFILNLFDLLKFLPSNIDITLKRFVLSNGIVESDLLVSKHMQPVLPLNLLPFVLLIRRNKLFNFG